jgi:prevent-host-death family protein
MGKHSIAEAQDRLAELIDRALEGEEVVITRDGAEVAEIRPMPPHPAKPIPRPMTEETLDWLRERRAGRRMSPVDAGTLLSRMRDEEEH